MGVSRKSMTWKGGMRFEGQSAHDIPIAVDSKKDDPNDEQGYSPSELLLFGIIGCTGMDTVSILKKMRQELTDLEISAEATQPDEYPRPYETVKLHYKFKGVELDPKLVERAIELSQTKYCMVSLTVAGKTDISYDIEIVE